jgi:hypothetical protein
VDIQVFFLGAFITGLKEISYTSKVAQEHNHGAGRQPRSIQRGKRTYEGSLGITQSEIESINRAARAKGFKDMLDLVDLDIVVCYAPKYSNVITTDVIHGISFSEMPKGMKEGDMSSTHTLPFLAVDIEYDAANPY